MMALKLGARAALPAEAARALALPLTAALAGCALSAWLEHVFYPHHALDRALIRGAFGLWLPLAAYVVADRMSRKRRLDAAIAPLPRYGVSRRASMAGALMALGGVLAITGACCGAVSVLVAHDARGLPVLYDLLLSAWIGALGGVAYAGWLGLCSGFGRGGRRGVFLILDLIFGSSSGAWALPFPRAHLRNLLGGAPPLDLSQTASAGLLTVLSLVVFLITLARVPD